MYLLNPTITSLNNTQKKNTLKSKILNKTNKTFYSFYSQTILYNLQTIYFQIKTTILSLTQYILQYYITNNLKSKTTLLPRISLNKFSYYTNPNNKTKLTI